MLKEGNMRKISREKLQEGLVKEGYLANSAIEFALLSAINSNKPLIVEGAPGAGKTSLAKAVSSVLKLPLKRVQFYEGLTADKILYDYNYQKQLLSIEAVKPTFEKKLEDKSTEEALKIASELDFYGEEFLIARPLLESITSDKRVVLLLDEIDKSSEEIEYTLLEFLEDYSMSIPELGTVHCQKGKEPIVILTSNNYRELSDPLKRRCSYLYIEDKSIEENTNILIEKTKVDSELAKKIAVCLSKFKQAELKQQPSIAEAISWAELLAEGVNIDDTIHLICKNKRDIAKVKSIIKGELDC